MEYGDDAEDESEISEKALATKLAYGLMCNHLLKMKTSVLHNWMDGGDLEESDVYDENRKVATMLEAANAKSCSWFN
ncbi:hypothetical protein ACFX1Q_030314 [Malus domestica]